MDHGKAFEKDFERSVEKASDKNLSIDRLYDNTAGFAGVSNICDYILYKRPRLYYFELKSVKGKSFDLGNIKEGKFRSITKVQYEGMLQKAEIQGVSAGVVVEYRMEDKEERQHYFIPIKVIQHLAQKDIKSINCKDAEKVGAKRIKSKRRRTRYDLDIADLLQQAQ